MQNNLVNILTPAYNTGKYIHRLLDSILSQTYPFIEMYVIDDGSTDNTKEVVNSYINKFNKRNYKLHYIYQKNQGQSIAINNGLKLLSGEFLVWPDSDDWYKEPYAIEHLVKAIKTTDEVGIARCKYDRINEKTGLLENITQFDIKENPCYIFDDVIKRKTIFNIEPGGIMIKLSLIDKIIPNRNIYTERSTGQNYQLVYPFIYHTKCVSLDERLFCYLIRQDSHSRGTFQGYERESFRLKVYKRTILSVFKSMGMPQQEYEEYEKYLAYEYSYWQLKVDFKYGKRKQFRSSINAMHNTNHKIDYFEHIIKTSKYKWSYLLSYMPFGFTIEKYRERLQVFIGRMKRLILKK